jgi:hypothetical protein
VGYVTTARHSVAAEWFLYGTMRGAPRLFSQIAVVAASWNRAATAAMMAVRILHGIAS